MIETFIFTEDTKLTAPVLEALGISDDNCFGNGLGLDKYSLPELEIIGSWSKYGGSFSESYLTNCIGNEFTLPWVEPYAFGELSYYGDSDAIIIHDPDDPRIDEYKNLKFGYQRQWDEIVIHKNEIIHRDYMDGPDDSFKTYLDDNGNVLSDDTQNFKYTFDDSGRLLHYWDNYDRRLKLMDDPNILCRSYENGIITLEIRVK